MRYQAIMTDWWVRRDGGVTQTWGVWDSLKGEFGMCGLTEHGARWGAEDLNRDPE